MRGNAHRGVWIAARQYPRGVTGTVAVGVPVTGVGVAVAVPVALAVGVGVSVSVAVTSCARASPAHTMSSRHAARQASTTVALRRMARSVTGRPTDPAPAPRR